MLLQVGHHPLDKLCAFIFCLNLSMLSSCYRFFTIPWTNALVGGGLRLGRQSMKAALQASLKRMGRSKIDLYSVSGSCPHWLPRVTMSGQGKLAEYGALQHCPRFSLPRQTVLLLRTE